jgi:hypothetical protein
MDAAIEVFKDNRILCNHEFQGGRRCGSPALHDETFCYYHHPTRKPVRTTQSDRDARRARRKARQAFAFDAPTNPRELQLALSEIMQRLAANQLDNRRAGQLLFALEITGRNLARGG